MKITFTDLKQTIEKLAEESPNCVYSNPERFICSYYRGNCSNDSIGCIVGQACRILGFSEEDLVKMDQHGDFMDVFWSEEFNSRFSLTDDEIHWISTVQGNQDFGYNWCEAVSAANRKIQP